ncbi:MAG: hypothetical protein U9Q33_10820 [Campylobacterota bacterium]|nr:hypothetical protein [Campylobacterota bacterium]
MSKKFICLIAAVNIVFANEISVFGAGDLNSPEPYGLSKTEEVIVKNKKELTSAKQKINRVNSSLDDISQRLEGLESISDSEGQKFFDLKNSLKKHTEEFTSYKVDNDNYKVETETSLNKLNDSIEKLGLGLSTNKRNISKLRKDFEKIVKLLNKINSQYVSKKEFNKLLDLLDKKESKKVSKTAVKKSTSSKETDFSSKTKKELMAEARVLFKKDYFTKAIPILEYLIKNKYRPAECNYLMGEIKYYRKKYSEALHYFKTSMMLYDKAKYLPKLLLHSAISFDKIGDKDNATNFYNTLIDVYPDSIEAKEASKKIN